MTWAFLLKINMNLLKIDRKGQRLERKWFKKTSKIFMRTLQIYSEHGKGIECFSLINLLVRSPIRKKKTLARSLITTNDIPTRQY